MDSLLSRLLGRHPAIPTKDMVRAPSRAAFSESRGALLYVCDDCGFPFSNGIRFGFPFEFGIARVFPDSPFASRRTPSRTNDGRLQGMGLNTTNRQAVRLREIRR